MSEIDAESDTIMTSFFNLLCVSLITGCTPNLTRLNLCTNSDITLNYMCTHVGMWQVAFGAPARGNVGCATDLVHLAA